MSTQQQDTISTEKQNNTSGLHAAATPVKSLAAFWKKFSNDWSFNLAAALAYNLLMSIFPIALALLAILGLVVGTLNHAAYVQLINTITHNLPSAISTNIQGTLAKQQHQLALDSTILGIIAIVLALFNGSRLFTLIEGCFGIIYRVRQRAFIQQNLMALGMLMLFIILVPLMVAAAALPAIAVTIFKSVLGNVPGSTVLVSFGGILGGLLSSYILFQAIYLIVPNQHISWKHSWRGSVTAAIALQIYLTLFPLYVAHFLTGYASSIGSIIILLIFFYYFAMILLLGAEVNAFFSEKITDSPADVVSLIKEATSHHAQAQPAAATADASDGNRATAQQNGTDTAKSHPDKREKKKKAAKLQGASSRGSFAIATIAGTALAFLVEWFHIRKK